MINHSGPRSFWPRNRSIHLNADVVTGKLDVCEVAANLPDGEMIDARNRDDAFHTESHSDATEHDMAKEAIT